MTDEPSVDSDAPRIPPALAGIPIIDAHVHAFPPRLFEAVWRWFDKYGWRVRYRLHALEAARYLLDRGVSRVTALHYAHVPGMASSLNEFAAELAREEPRVIPLATVLPGEPGARALVDHALGPLGLRGVKIHCHVQCVAADDPRLDDVYAAAAAHRVPVVIHAGDSPASPHYKCDVRALCTTDHIARALARHPRTTIVVPHLGASRMEELAALLGTHENLWLDTTMTLGRFLSDEIADPAVPPALPAELEGMFARAVAIVRAHPGRILYGTDFPNIPYEWDRELRALGGLALPAADLRAILGGNAARLFGLGLDLAAAPRA